MQVREDVPARSTKVDKLGFFNGQASPDSDYDQRLINYARAVEAGRAVGRDIGGGDPERMAPPRVAEYVQELFGKSSGIKVESNVIFLSIRRFRLEQVDIVKDKKTFEKEYPLYAAVNRAASCECWARRSRWSITNGDLLGVDRHHGRLIFLEYVGEGEINTTALFVGKGITFDTGGLDIKGRTACSRSNRF